MSSDHDWRALESFAFGDSPALADELLALVLEGKKTATCWAVTDELETAQPGERAVVCDGVGRPRAIIETLELTMRRFDEVDEAFAFDEGEGDRTLAYWRMAHEAYFARNGVFKPDMLLYCERFRLVEAIEGRGRELGGLTNMNAVFRLEGDTAITSPHAAGPWDPTMQHGAAPAALIAAAAERLPTAVPMRVARLTVDLLRPVPIAPLEIKSAIVREGRKIQLSQVQLLADGLEVARGAVLKIRAAEVALPDHVRETPVVLPGPDEGKPPRYKLSPAPGFTDGVSVSVVKGDFHIPGPAAMWFRVDRPIIADQEVTPLMRAVTAADFCNGTSALLDFRAFTFLNGDLTLSLARLPVGEWILLDAETWLGPEGAGIAAARLADRTGYFGRASQSVLVEARAVRIGKQAG